MSYETGIRKVLSNTDHPDYDALPEGSYDDYESEDSYDLGYEQVDDYVGSFCGPLLPATCRIWDGDTRIKLTHGTLLYHHSYSRHEEGYTSRSERFSYDRTTGRVSRETYSTSTDCDGRFDRSVRQETTALPGSPGVERLYDSFGVSEWEGIPGKRKEWTTYGKSRITYITAAQRLWAMASSGTQQLRHHWEETSYSQRDHYAEAAGY